MTANLPITAYFTGSGKTKPPLDENQSRGKTLMTKTNLCGECKFHLKRGVCPKAEYKNHEQNMMACLSSDSACELFQPKKGKDIKERIKHTPGFAKDGIVFEQIADAKYACGKNLEENFVFNHGDITYQPLDRCPWSLATTPISLQQRP